MSDALSNALSLAKAAIECLKSFVEVEKVYAESGKFKNQFLASFLENLSRKAIEIIEEMGMPKPPAPPPIPEVGHLPPKPMSEGEATALKIRRIIDLAEGLKTEDLEALINDLNAILSRKKGMGK
jgi:hypothetical protein